MQEEKKKLGMFDLCCLSIGGTIGSGIFVMMGIGIALTGRSVWLAVILGCLFMVLAYWYHPIMSSMFVVPGGDYDIKSMLYNPVITGLSGYVTCISSITTAVYGLAIVDYASMIFPGIKPYSKIIAVLIVTAGFAAAIKGSKFISTLTNIMTVIMIASIALFIGFGLPKMQLGNAQSTPFLMNGVGGLLAAVSLMGFACQGTTLPVSMMSVAKNPKRNVPLSMIPATIIVALIYGLMGIVSANILPIEEVAGQNLAAVAHQIFPNWLYIVFVCGGAICAIATSLLSFIAGMRYPTYKVAEDGWLPAVFKKTTKGGYPWMMQLLFYVVGILPTIFDFSLESIASLAMIPTLLLNAYLNLSLIKVVKKYPEQWKSSVFHMPAPVFNLLCVIASCCTLIMVYNLFTGLTPTEMILAAVMLVIFIVLSVIRLKTGAVKEEDLQAKREHIERRALEQEAATE